MANLPLSSERSPHWSAEALALAAQAKVLSGNKLEQQVVRLQRHTGRSREACWRFLIQYGIKGRVDYRRWTDEEIELVREELAKQTVEEVAKKLNRTPMSIRSMLRRNSLAVREIRCDLFSVESLAHALHVRTAEIRFWIQQGWLNADVNNRGKRHSYVITAEALANAYKHHLADLLKRRVRTLALFEAYLAFIHSPKHTIGEQLLKVRRDKRERAAFAKLQTSDVPGNEEDEQDEDGEDEERFGLSLDRDTRFQGGANTGSE